MIYKKDSSVHNMEDVRRRAAYDTEANRATIEAAKRLAPLARRTPDVVYGFFGTGPGRCPFCNHIVKTEHYYDDCADIHYDYDACLNPSCDWERGSFESGRDEDTPGF